MMYFINLSYRLNFRQIYEDFVIHPLFFCEKNKNRLIFSLFVFPLCTSFRIFVAKYNLKIKKNL
jgi:hypothetical protein